MAARLPTPGSDAGQWGEILNNYLLQSHNPDGTLRPGSVSTSHVVNNAITEVKLSADVQAKINSASGSAGATGPQGPAGPAGATGPAGPAGATGPQGDPGTAGSVGATGPQGAVGATGPAGADGDDGTSVTISGSVANQAALPTGLGAGDAGDGYITEDDGRLHVWSGSSWTDVGEIRGPEGPAGATGPQGNPGAQGATGPQGDPGTAGSVGATGPQGDPGTQGATGPQGNPGAPGGVGATGPTGATGPSGPGAVAATSSTLGTVQLAGDLGGTATSPTVPSMVRANMGGQEMVSTNTNAQGGVTLNLANGNVFDLTLTGNVSSLTVSGAAGGRALSFALYIKQDGIGGRTVNWPGSVQWIGDTPTLSDAPHTLSVFVFESLNGGTTWYGSAVGASSDSLAEVTVADLPAGGVVYTNTTARPTSRTDLMVIFTGADPGSAALDGDLWIGS